MKNQLIIVFICTLFNSCGTGPWFTQKGIYSIYKEPIYRGDNNYKIKTNGYYLQLDELTPEVSYRRLIIFFDNGYAISRFVDKDKEKELIRMLKSNTAKTDFNWWKVTESRLLNEDKEKELIRILKSNIVKTDFNWWKVTGDSLIIEYYVESKRQMMSWNYYQKGKMLNDTIIELRFDKSYDKSERYQFVKTNHFPIFMNSGRYLKKDWYSRNLHESRK